MLYEYRMYDQVELLKPACPTIAVVSHEHTEVGYTERVVQEGVGMEQVQS